MACTRHVALTFHLTYGDEANYEGGASERTHMQIVQADLSRHEHQRDVLAMTSMYALDAMGNHAPLAADVLQRLIPGLQNTPPL